MINETQLKKYCNEDIRKIENYEKAVNDKTQTWHCHHRLEIQGQFRNSRALLKRCGLYYNVPAWQLIFLTRSEHSKLHYLVEKNPMFGKHRSEEARKKLSMSHSGEKNPMFGKRGEKHPMFGKHHSEEARKKISLSHSGENNPMFGKHHSEETRKKLSM